MIPLRDVQHWLCPIKYDPGKIFFNIFQDWPMVAVGWQLSFEIGFGCSLRCIVSGISEGGDPY